MHELNLPQVEVECLSMMVPKERRQLLCEVLTIGSRQTSLQPPARRSVLLRFLDSDHPPLQLTR